MTDPISTATTRRAVLAGTAAIAGAAMLPAIPAIAEAAVPTLAPACLIDRAAFANRLHQWAMHVPQMGNRIDAMLADVERICATEEGSEMLIDAVDVCTARSGRQISFDWLIGGKDYHPNGQPVCMWLDETLPSHEELMAEMEELIKGVDGQQLTVMRLIAGAIGENDYKNARDWQTWGLQQAGVAFEQW